MKLFMILTSSVAALSPAHATQTANFWWPVHAAPPSLYGDASALLPTRFPFQALQRSQSRSSPSLALSLRPSHSSRLSLHARPGRTHANSVAGSPGDSEDVEDDDDEDMLNRNESRGKKTDREGLSARPVIKTRFSTMVTFIPVKTEADYIGTRLPPGTTDPEGAEDAYRDALWIDARNLGAAYYAPTVRALSKLKRILKDLATLSQHKGEAFDVPPTIRERALRSRGAKTRKEPSDQGDSDDDGQGDRDDAGDASSATNQPDGKPLAASASSTGKTSLPPTDYETQTDFAQRLDDFLARSIGREALEARLHKSIYEARDMRHRRQRQVDGEAAQHDAERAPTANVTEQGTDAPSSPLKSPAHSAVVAPGIVYHNGIYLPAADEDHTGDKQPDTAKKHAPAIPLVHESSIVIAADDSVINMLLRRLLLMSDWRLIDIDRLVQPREEAPRGAGGGHSVHHHPIQFSIDQVDTLPLLHGRLSRTTMRKTRRSLETSLVTWPFS